MAIRYIKATTKRAFPICKKTHIEAITITMHIAKTKISIVEAQSDLIPADKYNAPTE